MTEERTKGHCPHGEFYLDEGCPQCIAEDRLKRAREGQNLFQIVKVKYLDEAGEPAGRSYSYFTEEPLALGDVVQVPVRDDHSTKAQVVEINVPEHEIAAFKDRVKLIPSGSKRPPTQDAAFVPAEEPAPIPEISDQEEETEIEKIDRMEAEARPEPDLFHSLGVPPEETKVAEAPLTDAPVEYPPALVPIEHKFGPPTSQELFRLYQEAAGLLKYAKERVISSNADLKPATDDLAIILKCRQALEARKKELVGPIRAELDRFNQAFNDLIAPVLEADQITKKKIAEFDQEQRRKAAEARRIEDEKNRLAREEAALNGTGEITVPLGTAEAPPPVPERTRTDQGTLSGRANWKARVVDFKALPDEYKLPNESLLNAYARTHKGQGEIPGVEFYDDRIYSVRTKN